MERGLKMAIRVKSIEEAQKYLSGGNPNTSSMSQNEVSKIVGDVKEIISGIKELKSLAPQQQPQPQAQTPQPEPKPANQEIRKTPIAKLNISDKELDDFLTADTKKLLDNPNIDKEMTLRQIVERWDFIKEAIKPEFKKAIEKIAKAEIEFK